MHGLRMTPARAVGLGLLLLLLVGLSLALFARAASAKEWLDAGASPFTPGAGRPPSVASDDNRAACRASRPRSGSRCRRPAPSASCPPPGTPGATSPAAPRRCRACGGT